MRAKNVPFVVTLVAAGLFLSGFSTAFADVSYTYTGNNFTQFKNTSREPQLFSPADSLSFSFTVSDYLETGGVLQDIDSGSVSFWKMSAGSVTFGSTHGDVIDNVAVAASRTSAPSSWWFSGISDADFASSFTSFGGPLSPGDPSDQVVIVYPYFEEGSDATYAVNGANVFTSGTWTVSSDSVLFPCRPPCLSWVRACSVSAWCAEDWLFNFQRPMQASAHDFPDRMPFTSSLASFPSYCPV
jgi:hypothetical protein